MRRSVAEGVIKELAWRLKYQRSLDRKELIEICEHRIRMANEVKEKLRNPINSRTGEPLKPTTLNQYKRKY